MRGGTIRLAAVLAGGLALSGTMIALAATPAQIIAER